MGRTLSSDSANVIALPASPTGFTVGDYVYQTTSGYGAVPAAALATGNFNLGAVASPDYDFTATASNELTYVEQLGGSQGSQVAAQLTNGNIVYAYATGSPTTYAAAATVNFRIETSSGTPVVAQTSTTMTTQGPFYVGVIALPAGGFCIVSSAPSGSNYVLSARFYNADGTAATAVLNLATAIGGGASTSRLKLQAQSDGSVILGYFTPNTLVFRKVTTAGFDATFGSSGSYGIGITNTALQGWDFLVDGSNNIQIIYTLGTGSAVMARANSVGQQQTASSVTLTGVAAVAIVRSSDGTIRGIVQDSTGITTLTWDGTTTALGTRIITSTTPPAAGALGAFAQGASGDYVVFYNDFIGGTSAIGLFFQAFSSANASLAAATRVNSAIAINYRNQLTPIVISGNTRVYFGVYQANALSYSFSNSAVPMGIAYFTYSNTTYALVGAPTAGFNYGDQGPFALGAYMRGVSTAATARFTIATTGTYPINNTLGTTLIPKTIVDTETVIKLNLAPLPNGEFVAVWVRNSTGITFISKYSSTGVLQAGPVAVTTGPGATAAQNASSVSTFANGNILVTYCDSPTSTLRFRIYTPSLTVVTSGDIDTAVKLPTNTPVACASFGDGDHIAVAFLDSNDFIQVRCVQSTGTVTARLGVGLTSQTSWFQLQVIGFKSNAFTIAAVDASTTIVRGFSVRKTGPTSFLGSSEVTIGASFANISGALCAGSPIATPGSAGFYISGNTDSNSYRIISVNPLFNDNNQLNTTNTSGTLSGYSLGTTYSATIGYTATGLPVIVAHRGSTAFLTLSAFTNPMGGGGAASTAGVTTALATTGSQVSVSAIPHIGDAILIGFIDSSNKAAFTSIVASPFTVSGTLTAGTDISTSTLALLPQAGFAFQGVAITAAASGSTGLVQTSGIATLNSNYSASTPATFFDSRNPITAGTSGTIIGRTVIMGNN